MKTFFLSLIIFCSLAAGAQKHRETYFNSLTTSSSGIRYSDTAWRGCVIGEDSFAVRYVYGKSSYMETLVGRWVCDSLMGYDTTACDNCKDGILVMRKGGGCHEDTAGYRMNRHYFATATVYQVEVCKCLYQRYENIPIGKPFFSYYVPAGCFEDNPALLVEEAQKKIKDNTIKVQGDIYGNINQNN